MKKLNNKGFSLVELIIVIAIMAILVGVVGTQVIPYLESSRQAKDIQVFSSWNTSALSAYSNCAAKIDANATYTITVTLGATSSVKTTATDSSGNVTTGCSDIDTQFENLTSISKFDASKLESREGQKVKKITFTIDPDGNIEAKILGDSDAEVAAFEGAIKNN